MQGESNQANNKRIAKNTMLLYARMLLMMGVSLYTSRVVLNALGVEDFGIYNVVGGVIGMFAFLHNSMSGATTRFITYELGGGDLKKLRKTFSATLTIHILIALILLLLCETIGLWWLENKLVIAPERMYAARWVYHLSIFSVIISVTQIPYNATIIAHERMGVYAYVEILNSVLRLLIVYLLVLWNFDKLILYAILTLSVTIVITTVYKIYCAKHFLESHYKFEWNKLIINPMLSFSGWNFLGNFSFTLKTQGVNMILNFFFGVLLNAAYGISQQVQNAVMGFVTNFLMATRPQIIKYYASNELDKMKTLVVSASKFSFFLMLIISLPLIVESHFILHLWLKTVPDYAVSFSQLTLLYGIVWSLNCMFSNAIDAKGNIKKNNIVNSFITLLVCPLSFFLFKNGFSPITPFVINVILLFFAIVYNLYYLSTQIKQFLFWKLFLEVLVKSLSLLIFLLLTLFFLSSKIDEGCFRFVVVFTLNVSLVSFLSFIFLLNREERITIQKVLKEKIINKLI